MNHDVITVGGGLGGSALALSLARKGVRVLVLEREIKFKDRVRGEGILPWGVNEARDLGVYDLLANSCARPVLFWQSHAWKQRPPRDLVKTTPRGSHCLNFYHPAMQEVMLGAAEQAGATVRREVVVTGVEPGQPPKVISEYKGHRETWEARLVVGADGRSSRVRTWGGFHIEHDPECLMIAGVLLEGVQIPEEANHVFRNSSEGEGALLFPQADGRVRAYYIYRKRGKRLGLSGKKNVPRLLDGCIHTGVPAEWIQKANPAGPLAEFEGADSWTPHPYGQGVALIGAAAASNDPSWGNGLSVTLRDVRTLQQSLLADNDWDRAGDDYAAAHDQDFGVINRVNRWLTELLYEIGPEADKRRDRAFALMQEDRSRNPDYIALGLESPSDEKARKRMFGEE